MKKQTSKNYLTRLLTKNIFFSLIALGTISCGYQEDTSDLAAIIGEDQRAFKLEQTLKKSIGKISLNGEEYCTGFISGNFEVTTAAHCLYEDVSITEYKFITADGNTFTFAGVEEYNENTDLARLDLNRAASDFLEVGDIDFKQDFSLAGWNSQSGSFFESKKIEKESFFSYKSFLMHSLDTTPSSSGSPIMQNGKVVGVHLGYVADINYNIGLILTNRHLADGMTEYTPEKLRPGLDPTLDKKAKTAIESGKKFLNDQLEYTHRMKKIQYKSKGPSSKTVKEEMETKKYCQSCHGED